MREPVQEAALLNVLNLQHDIAIAASAGSCHYILVEGKRDEDDEHE